MIRLLLTLLILSFPASLLAELPATLESDFAPLDGYVVMPMEDDEFLIDLDASDGLRIGDIFSILHPGQPIVHPVSGEVIGHLDGNAAFLQVTRIKSGYSYARKIDGTAKVSKGEAIHRFAGVPTGFSASEEGGSELQAQLQQKLTRLDWQAPGSSPAPLLLFESNVNSLRVRTRDGAVLFQYPLSGATPTQLAPAPSALNPGLQPAAVAAPTSAQQTVGILHNQTNSARIWHGAEYKDEVVGVRVDDFDNDGLLETALLLQQKLVVSRYQGNQRSEIDALELTGLTPLAIDSIDLNGNGKAEIVLSALRAGVPASSVYELNGPKLTQVAKDLPFLARRIDQPDGTPLLLGQKRLDLKEPFSGRPFQVVFASGSYQQGADYPLPSKVNLYGFAPVADAEGMPLIAYLNSSDYLTILSAEGDTRFESPDHFGGSETRFELATENSGDLVQFYFVPLRVVVRNGEILVPQNEGQRMTQRWRSYKKSRLVSLKWNGLSLDESWRTSDQSGQTADFGAADIDNDGQQELIVAVKFSRKGLLSRAKSALVVYELN